MKLSKDDLYEIEKILDVQAGSISEQLNRLCNTAIHFDALNMPKPNPLDKPIKSMNESYDTVKLIRDKLKSMRCG